MFKFGIGNSKVQASLSNKGTKTGGFAFAFVPVKYAVALTLLIALSACGGGSSSSTPTPAPAPPTASPPPAPPVSDNPNIPAGGESIITASPESDFNLDAGNNNGPVGNAFSVNVEHPDFDKAIQIDIEKPNGQFWNGQINFPITQALSEGDVVLLYLQFKMLESTDETGTGFVTAFVESPAPDYTKYLFYQLVSSGEWQEYYLPMTIGDDFAANEISLKFGFGNGSKSQSVQLGNITLLNYKQSLSIDDLPKTEPTYIGRDPDAAWRQEAAARIEEHRKRDFSIQVLSNKGTPLANADVEINFKRHHYHFGSVAAARHLIGTSDNDRMYREKLLENFNQSGIENNLKWSAWIGDWGETFSQQNAIDALQWLEDNDMYARGHVLIWPSKRNMPEFVQQYMPEGDPASADPQVLEEVSAHIRDISGKTKGLVDEWDVLNEPFDNHYLMDAFGDDVMVDWFELAESENSNIPLYINDYSIISGGGTNAAHQDHFFNTIDFLLANNAPLHGIGVQSHFSTTPTPITRIYSILDRFHSAFPDLAIRSTEFDVDTLDEQMQADFTRDFLTIFFSHPATVGVQKWGFWAGAHWRPNAAMYTEDWQAKPNQQAWHQTVYETFWNDFSGTTDEQGKFTERGFYGDYEILVNIEGQTQRFPMRLIPQGENEFIIRID
uniref:endo-1,4-beta-xylanase n=1 Tax=Ningiella ruwaisensis TaxID=2364274 RepID=UPI00109FA7E6|nr:endo-1,4-beta-xylanase [Ningiella ruwaisensis]